jgi:adenylosuccinate synthase
MLGEQALDFTRISEHCAQLRERLAPHAIDASVYLDRALAAGRRVLFEGAQGTMLDVDHGTFPFVTSSNTVAAAACTGGGIAPGRINTVVGITKAYTTRVGGGPFPTELLDDLGEKLRHDGEEFGATTGRPRRCGWFDAVVARHAVRLNGLTGLAVTKLDVLTGLKVVRACVGYEVDGRRVDEVPASLAALSAAQPVYEDFPGWEEPLSRARGLDDLPANARRYLTALEELTGTPIFIVSVGARRQDTIILHHAFNV